MKSLRLQALASFVQKEDKVADVGCDHAYVAIYLAQNHLCKRVIATDVNQNALENAKKNIRIHQLQQKIPTFLSDGIKNIKDEDVDTLLISGMGANTIIHILEEVDRKKIKKLILQSNNDFYLLRTSVLKKGYYLQQEKVVFEKGHYYPIGVYTLASRHLNLCEKYFGIYNVAHKEYYLFLKQELDHVYKKIGFKHFKSKCMVLFKLLLLKKYL